MAVTRKTPAFFNVDAFTTEQLMTIQKDIEARVSKAKAEEKARLAVERAEQARKENEDRIARERAAKVEREARVKRANEALAAISKVIDTSLLEAERIVDEFKDDGVEFSISVGDLSSTYSGHSGYWTSSSQ